MIQKKNTQIHVDVKVSRSCDLDFRGPDPVNSEEAVSRLDTEGKPHQIPLKFFGESQGFSRRLRGLFQFRQAEHQLRATSSG